MGAKWNYTLLALLAFMFVKAQVNLVLNPGFEQYSLCPNSANDFEYLYKWYSSKGSCDYFNTCANNNSGITIPNNFAGQQEVFEGNGYAGILTYVTPHLWYAPPPPGNLTVNYFWDVPEFFGIKLKYNLIAGHRYNCGFYVSLADSFYYATKNMGMLFTPDSIHEPESPTDNDTYYFNIYMIDSLEPQVRYTGNDFLSDRNGWTKIEGSFIAEGTEQYLYIGDFDHNPLNDTLFVFDSTYHYLNPEVNYNDTYYYIDDVWVYEDTTIGINEQPVKPIKIYPNPAQDFVSIELPPTYIKAQLSIYNLTGQLVMQKQIAQANQTIPITELSNGVYVFVVESGGEVVGRKRVVISK